MNVITKTVSLPDGRTISIETGKLAKQADGAVMLRMNNTVLLATVCGAKPSGGPSDKFHRPGTAASACWDWLALGPSLRR